MLVYLAFNTMEGAMQHLLALSALLNHELGPSAVALAVEAEARNCCEASARVAWLLDQAVKPEDRIARGLTASLQSLPLDDAKMDAARQAVQDVATRLNLVVKVNKDGKPVWVGSEPPRSSRLFETYLGDLIGSDQTAKALWKRWSQVAHVEPYAAFTRPMTANLGGFMVSAASAAAGAHLLANQRTWEYLGRWQDEPFAKRVIGSSAPMMLALLSSAEYRPSSLKPHLTP
jgi:hypothetical protein